MIAVFPKERSLLGQREEAIPVLHGARNPEPTKEEIASISDT